jgi:hypothetical protein
VRVTARHVFVYHVIQSGDMIERGVLGGSIGDVSALHVNLKLSLRRPDQSSRGRLTKPLHAASIGRRTASPGYRRQKLPVNMAVCRRWTLFAMLDPSGRGRVWQRRVARRGCSAPRSLAPDVPASALCWQRRTRRAPLRHGRLVAAPLSAQHCPRQRQLCIA